MYVGHFGPRDFVLGDIRDLHGSDLPGVALATASFPCTDLSLAGNRKGLKGEQSGMFWEYARILREMKGRRSFAIMLENVPSFASSHGGRDLYLAIRCLNRLGYWCDILVIDARRFVPQSRPRLFIVGSRSSLDTPSEWCPGRKGHPFVLRRRPHGSWCDSVRPRRSCAAPALASPGWTWDASSAC